VSTGRKKPDHRKALYLTCHARWYGDELPEADRSCGNDWHQVVDWGGDCGQLHVIREQPPRSSTSAFNVLAGLAIWTSGLHRRGRA